MPTITITTLNHEERRERRKKMAEHCQVSENLQKTAVHFGVTPETVRNACLEHGVRLPHPNLILLTRVALFRVVRDLMSTKRPLTGIADSHNVSWSLVRDIYRDCRKAKLPVVDRSQGRGK